MLALLTAVVVVAFGTWWLMRQPADLNSEVGRCVQVSGGSGAARIVDCGAAHIGRVTAVITPGGACPSGTIGRMRVDGRSGQLCVGAG